MKRWMEKISSWSQVLQPILTTAIAIMDVIAFIFAFKDAKRTFNYIGIAHISQIPSVIRCSVSEFNLRDKIIPPNELVIEFMPTDCESIDIQKKRILAGILTQSLICGGIDNFQVFVNPPQANFRARDPNCAGHKSLVEVSFITIPD